MLYHVSPAMGLKVLEPRISTHGQPWVYAVADRATALLFGAKQDDFDFRIDTLEGRPAIWECYPGALEECYQNRECSVYQVAEEGFLSGQTDWDAEWVNPAPVPVVKETHVPDLLSALRQAERNGELTIRTYEDTPAYRRMVSQHVVNRLVRFDCIHTAEERLVLRYGGILRLLRQAVSGEELNDYAHH